MRGISFKHELLDMEIIKADNGLKCIINDQKIKPFKETKMMIFNNKTKNFEFARTLTYNQIHDKDIFCINVCLSTEMSDRDFALLGMLQLVKDGEMMDKFNCFPYEFKSNFVNTTDYDEYIKKVAFLLDIYLEHYSGKKSCIKIIK